MKLIGPYNNNFSIDLGDYKGYDPYDIFYSEYLENKNLPYKLSLLITQVNKYLPINLRTLLKVPEHYDSKGMALILSGLLRNGGRENEIEFIYEWLRKNKSDHYSNYSIGFMYPIKLKTYSSQINKPSLIISLFVIYSLIDYYKKTNDKSALQLILSFYRLIESELPKKENSEILFYSYNFDAFNEIFNATAKVGKFYSKLFTITNDKTLLVKVKKILEYLASVQRKDGSWPYSVKSNYTDGFHTAFILDAILEMMKLVQSSEYENMTKLGIDFYVSNLLLPTGQPLYFSPKYSPKDLRKIFTQTDIRDCAMALILTNKLKKKELTEKILSWTIRNMYDPKGKYFYFYKEKFWINKINYLRPQAWMYYSLSKISNTDNEN